MNYQLGIIDPIIIGAVGTGGLISQALMFVVIDKNKILKNIKQLLLK